MGAERLVHPALPAATACVAVLTLVLCVSITLGTGTYIGGLAYPFFSDTGRDKDHGQYYIFATGLTLTGILWAATTVGMQWLSRQLAETVGKGTRAGCLAATATGFSFAAAPFLPLVSIFDTVNFSTVHNLSAYAFFAFALVACILYTLALGTIASRAPSSAALARSTRIKRVNAVLLFLFVLVYLPIGLSVACAPQRLTVAKCETEGMSAAYCDSIRMGDDPSLTKLWDYSSCAGATTMRSVFQLLSVLALLCFIGGLAVDFRAKDELLALRGDEAQAVDV